MANNAASQTRGANPEAVVLLPDDAFETRTPEQVRMMRDESDVTLEPYQVQTHPNYRAYWAHPKNEPKLYNAGYEYVYKKHVTQNPVGELKPNQVRVLMGQALFDGAERLIRRMIDKEEPQVLMVIRQDLWKEFQEIKANKRVKAQTQSLRGNDAEVLESIKDPQTRRHIQEQMERGTSLSIDQKMMED